MMFVSYVLLLEVVDSWTGTTLATGTKEMPALHPYHTEFIIPLELFSMALASGPCRHFDLLSRCTSQQLFPKFLGKRNLLVSLLPSSDENEIFGTL
jgi:hypothetical protein